MAAKEQPSEAETKASIAVSEPKPSNQDFMLNQVLITSATT